jgi:23S rRNA (uridine2552-2'-O)-methyltransferase
MRLDQAKRDYYRRRAKEEGYRSRAAFKLKEMNNKYHLMRRGSKVVDIGSAPGGWTQVSSELVGNVGQVVSVDLEPVKPVSKNTTVLEEDITSSTAAESITNAFRGDKADLVLADLSPKLSGVWDMDHYKQIDLCNSVVDILPSILKSSGSSVMKAFHGDEFQGLVKRLKESFGRLEISKPNASRKESSEVYLVGLKFTGQVPRRHPGEFPSLHQSEAHLDSTVFDWQESPETRASLKLH